MPTIPNDVIAAAQLAHKTWGVPASVTLAQWALESGWGARVPPGSFNTFGIKAAPGQPAVSAKTREVVNGKSIFINAAFRKFDSYAQAFNEHARLLAQGERYEAARAALPNAIAYATALTGNYATDPSYGVKLISIMHGSNLFRYDT